MGSWPTCGCLMLNASSTTTMTRGCADGRLERSAQQQQQPAAALPNHDPPPPPLPDSSAPAWPSSVREDVSLLRPLRAWADPDRLPLPVRSTGSCSSRPPPLPSSLPQPILTLAPSALPQQRRSARRRSPRTSPRTSRATRCTSSRSTTPRSACGCVRALQLEPRRWGSPRQLTLPFLPCACSLQRELPRASPATPR